MTSEKFLCQSAKNGYLEIVQRKDLWVGWGSNPWGEEGVGEASAPALPLKPATGYLCWNKNLVHQNKNLHFLIAFYGPSLFCYLKKKWKKI